MRYISDVHRGVGRLLLVVEDPACTGRLGLILVYEALNGLKGALPMKRHCDDITLEA